MPVNRIPLTRPLAALAGLFLVPVASAHHHDAGSGAITHWLEPVLLVAFGALLAWCLMRFYQAMTQSLEPRGSDTDAEALNRSGSPTAGESNPFR
ncbi:MAG: hypothetical protein AAGH19_06440 [Pseudomonadota bacterium]